MVQIMEKIHSNKIIFRNVKPNKFLLVGGIESRNREISIVGFEYSKAYKNLKGEHFPYKEGTKIHFDKNYASLNATNGIDLTRRDDLEMVGNILIRFMKGSLPWWNGTTGRTVNEKKAMLKKIKNETSLE
jgi:hypothetical protein